MYFDVIMWIFLTPFLGKISVILTNIVFHFLIVKMLITTKIPAKPKYYYVKLMKIIFLDVDGVLNSYYTKETFCGYIGIEDKKVKLLKEIVDSSKAIIILVSSWKVNWSKYKETQDEMANYLDKKFAKENLFIYDKTIDDIPYNRGLGIKRYLKKLSKDKLKVEKFIILDDETFDYKETRLMSHLIKSEFRKDGLTKELVELAKAKLK